MKLLMIGCILSLLVAGFKPGQQNKNYKAATIDTSKYTILQFDEKRDHYRFDKDVKAVALSAGDIKKVDELFNVAVKRHGKQSKYNPQSAARYYKQVVAVVNSRGEKIIWINCFCANDFPYWKTTLVSVLDGGSCFFSLNINLNTGEDYNFAVNGVA